MSLVETSVNGTCDDPHEWTEGSNCAAVVPAGAVWLLGLIGVARRRR